MLTNNLIFKCTEETVPMHFYEAMQIFAHLFGMPKFEVNQSENELVTPEKTYTFSETEKNNLKRELYIILTEVYDYKSPWGCMTGVRPTKILHKLLQGGMTIKEAENHLRDFYLLSEDKLSLVLETYENQKQFLKQDDNVCSFYLGVPFCPTICSYCTFGSSPLYRYKKQTTNYANLLCEEFIETIKHTQNYSIESLYFGGGTPTTLSADELDLVLKTVSENVDIESLKEFSVEAGRPDTITPEKLEILRKYGVSRISINPQTMNEKTLKRIGRSHSTTDIEDVFNTARSLGFDNINMDLICGLPGETYEDFQNTLYKVLTMEPECITVHTLALKRASNLTHDEDEIDSVAMDETYRMTTEARHQITSLGYHPFYMYRQKNCVGNNENVCYCKPGFESPYNIHIMEEDQTIFACGTGAVTKIVKDGNISRFFNMKSVEDYMSRFEGELTKKIDFLS